MEYAAFAVAVLALLLALKNRGAGAVTGAALDDARSAARRRVENLGAELRAELETTRKLLSAVAAGQPLDREQILEGRLWRDVGPDEALALVGKQAVRLLDVRTHQEVALGTLPGAQHVPIDQLEDRLGEIVRDGHPTLVYCAGGGRSAAACEALSQRGYDNLLNLAGGIGAWSGPIERPTA